MKIILNIGLDVAPENSPTGGPMTLFSPGVREAVELKLGRIDNYQEGGSNTEQTAIVAATTESDDIHGAVSALATMLMQDAIAYTVDGVGYMAGPKAEAWGPFNPAFFLLSATERMK